MTRIRLKLAGVAALVVVVGLLARFGLTGAVANTLGVALWSVLVYVLAVFVHPPVRPVVCGLITLGISYGVEFFQLTGIPLELAKISGLFRLVFGTHFAVDDFPGYTAGVLVATLVHAVLTRRASP